ncbi:hypothetical protein [Roseococcus pinisoli]|uniref:Uncharacterized protein n=1 Tax=Roseococcus pinisoli TaxID=2835040 RepID=A0ABS5QH93_9PROT|nr:hypothetical protein [Roseococcus pinisoli]MBS7813006.1 hypothetical protein [Roseococcus pinisoli]
MRLNDPLIALPQSLQVEISDRAADQEEDDRACESKGDDGIQSQGSPEGIGGSDLSAHIKSIIDGFGLAGRHVPLTVRLDRGGVHQIPLLSLSGDRYEKGTEAAANSDKNSRAGKVGHPARFLAIRHLF